MYFTKTKTYAHTYVYKHNICNIGETNDLHLYSLGIFQHIAYLLENYSQLLFFALEYRVGSFEISAACETSRIISQMESWINTVAEIKIFHVVRQVI